MRRRFIFLLLVVSLGLLAWGTWAAVTVKQASPGDDVPATGSVATSLLIGPYLRNVTSTSVSITWQTSATSTGEVRITGGGESASQATSPRRLSQVTVSGLSPDTEYEYTLSIGGKEAARSKFRTYPDKPGVIKFAVYGDSRGGPSRHKRVAQAIAGEAGIEFVLHTGDLTDNGRNLRDWVVDYFAPARDLIARVPVYPVLGNHEQQSSNFFRYFGESGAGHWYSFDLPNVHVIGLDSNVAFDVASDQYKWLVSDLESHKAVRWKIVFLHHPPYSSGNHSNVDTRGVPRDRQIRVARQILPALAAKYGIRAVFAGHDHAYERSQRDGVLYVVSGGGGAGLYGEPNAAGNPFRKMFYSGLHYCVVTLDGNKGAIIVKAPGGKIIDKAEF